MTLHRDLIYGNVISPFDRVINRCLICDALVPNYIPEMCCSGEQCGCRGQPTNPCVCSDACEEALFKYIGLSMDERRIKAGIVKWGMIGPR